MRVKKRISRSAVAAAAAAVLTAGLYIAPAAAAAPGSFIGRLGSTTAIASTVPANGDVNPYGVAVVQHSQGKLRSGDVLVSNFNECYRRIAQPRVQVVPVRSTPW